VTNLIHVTDLELDQGQGGAQGMEDGLVLGIVLHGATTPEEVEKRLQLYVDVRRNRASSIQILSNVGQDQSHMVRQELLQFMKEEEIPSKSPFLRERILDTDNCLASVAGNYKYNFGYDIVKAALDAMKNYDPSFELPSDFFEGEVIPVPDAHDEVAG
jgi:salicylate hydroxylase